MAISIEESLSLLASPEKIWPILTDVPRWWQEFYDTEATYPQNVGWGGPLRLVSGAGLGMRFAAFRGTRMLQSMQVTEWTPPTRLALRSDPWDTAKEEWPRTAKLMNFGHGQFSQFFLAYPQCRFFLGCDLTSISAVETRLSMRFEFKYLHPFYDFLFWIPARNALRQGVRRFLRKFPQFLGN